MKNFAEKAKSHPDEHMTRIYGHLNFFLSVYISVIGVIRGKVCGLAKCS